MRGDKRVRITSLTPIPRRFDWLALPHNVEVAPAEAVACTYYSLLIPPCEIPVYVFLDHPHREQWHRIGQKFRQRFNLDFGDSVEPPYTPPPHGTCRVQAVRSVSDWSHGVLTEHSIQNACTSTRFPTASVSCVNMTGAAHHCQTFN